MLLERVVDPASWSLVALLLKAWVEEYAARELTWVEVVPSWTPYGKNFALCVAENELLWSGYGNEFGVEGLDAMVADLEGVGEFSCRCIWNSQWQLMGCVCFLRSYGGSRWRVRSSSSNSSSNTHPWSQEEDNVGLGCGGVEWAACGSWCGGHRGEGGRSESGGLLSGNSNSISALVAVEEEHDDGGGAFDGGGEEVVGEGEGGSGGGDRCGGGGGCWDGKCPCFSV